MSGGDRQAVQQLLDLYRAGRFAEAMAHGEALAAADPGDAAVFNILGATCAALKQLDRAFEAYTRARALAPADGGIGNNLGNALVALGRHDEAIACYGEAARLRPDIADPPFNLGNLHVLQGHPAEAAAAYGRALAVQPDHAQARAMRLYQLGHVADWDAMAADRSLIPALGLEGMPVSPFAMLALDDDPGRQLARARRYQAGLAGQVKRRGFPRPARRPARLRIGYFSADFHDHATMYLAAGLFERIDRSRFELFAYSHGPDRDDAMRRRLCAAVDRFRDVRTVGDDGVANLACQDGLDVAVDLMGLTAGARPGILAHGAAPVQISHVGYPGSPALPSIDYIVADPVLIPPEQRAHYAERLILLPPSFLVTDDRAAIALATPSRREAGLPEQGFVFACFNNSYKIGPDIFDMWMRLLAAVPGSVLWLRDSGPAACANLRREAERRGVAGDRLVFAAKIPHAEHLARHALADLALDTLRFNGHTTTVDALWAGLPVLTCPGASFPARVAASLLSAAGLPELIASGIESYEATALTLATNPARLKTLRDRLAGARAGSALFDTAGYARRIEQAFDLVFERFMRGEAPADTTIA